MFLILEHPSHLTDSGLIPMRNKATNFKIAIKTQLGIDVESFPLQITSSPGGGEFERLTEDLEFLQHVLRFKVCYPIAAEWL